MESNQSPTAEIETISITEHARERAAFGIRMLAGIDIDAVIRETGVDLRDICREATRQCIDEGLLDETGSRLCLTEKGILFADLVASRMLG